MAERRDGFEDAGFAGAFLGARDDEVWRRVEGFVDIGVCDP